MVEQENATAQKGYMGGEVQGVAGVTFGGEGLGGPEKLPARPAAG